MRCRRCGNENPQNARRCMYCNTALDGNNYQNLAHNANNNSQPIKNKNSFFKKEDMPLVIIISILAVVFVAIIGVVLYKNFAPGKIGFSGGGGGGMASSATYKVSFDLNYDSGEENPEEQIVDNGAKAIIPDISERKGYAFGGWFEDNTLSKKFDFSKPVKRNYKLVAYWIDLSDTTDTDGDGLRDPFELYYGTDKTKVDTDGDGLSDYLEISILSLNPLKQDTNDDKVSDGDEDFDGDELSNKKEVESGTDPSEIDSDMDGLKDGEEVSKYNTNPAKRDTDNDGASDGKEVEIGTDPLVVQKSFDVDYKIENASDTVTPSVEIKLSGNQVDSLKIEKVENDVLFPETMPGYMGSAYDFFVNGYFGQALIKFEFAAKNNSEPVIYYFDESNGKLIPLQTTVNGNVASAVVNHFSTYILIDRKIFEEEFKWVDSWDNTVNYSSVEIVLVVDDSGSMTSNDASNQRLDVAKTLIDNLPEKSKVGVVRFESSAEVLTSALTENKEEAKGYLNTTYFKSSGGTKMYDAIGKAMGLFQSTDKSVMKLAVVLSDGDTSDKGSHSSIVSMANSKGIRVYTVGLGSSSLPYFDSYLKPLANSTNASFYLAENASELASIYKDINEKIDILTDTDKDGVPDYYEENLVLFNGTKVKLNKDNHDTDGDGVDDGKEVVLTYEYRENRTKVIVTGKVLSDPTKIDTDNDGIKDDIDTAPLKKGLKNGIVGALTICSYGDDVKSSGGISGHAYLAYTSFVNDKKVVYGVMVGSLREVSVKNDSRTDKPAFHTIDLKCNTVTTFGGWAAWLPEQLKGSWINNEYHLFLESGVPSDQRSLTKYVTDEQVDIIAKATKKCSKWTELYNCSAYATDIWDMVFDDGLSAQFVWCSPSTLSYNIEKQKGYKIAAPMLAPMP